MPFVTAPELLAAAKAGKIYGDIKDLAGAQAYLDYTLATALANKQRNKDDRPWHLVDLTAQLDPKQAWIGFEFETGFDNKKEYDQFINFLWGQDHTAIDKEGTGVYPVEVAFAPQNLNDVIAGNSTLQQTLEFIHDNKLTPALNPTTFTCRDVGIHAGLSTPKFRKAKGTSVRRLSNILADLTNPQMDKLYGRHALHWGTAHDRNSYIELKMFRAIPELAVVKGYIDVVTRIAPLVDFLIDNPDVKALANTYNFLSGKDKEPKAA